MRFPIAVAFVFFVFASDEGRGQTARAQRSSAFIPPPISYDQTVIVKGSPSLTRRVVENTIGYFSWLFETQIPDKVRAAIQADLVADWQRHNPSEIESDLELAKGYETIAALNPGLQAEARSRLLPATLAALQSKANPIALRLLSVYNAAHPQAASAGPDTQRARQRASGGQDVWRPDSQVGDFRFDLPKGWKQMQAPAGTILVPNGLSQPSVVMIGFLPAETLRGDLASWFRAAWAEWQKQFQVLQAGQIERRHNPNGVDVLSLEARVTNPRFGYSDFILAAAQIGNQVEPYFFLCSADFYQYRDAFNDFEHSLTFANLTSNVPESGIAGGLKGLYVGYKVSGDYSLGFRPHNVHLVFFPDGNVIRYLPKEGLENFDFRAARKNSRDYCGYYRMNGHRFTIHWADQSIEEGERAGATLRIGSDSMPYQPTSHSDGLMLDGSYRTERGGLRGSMRFSPDGYFTEAGVLEAVDYASSRALRGGSGLYHIKDNTLTLSYEDGPSIRISFYVSADEEGSRQPKFINLNTHALERGN